MAQSYNPNGFLSSNDELFSESFMTQYQDLLNEQAQAAAVRMIGIPTLSEKIPLSAAPHTSDSTSLIVAPANRHEKKTCADVPNNSQSHNTDITQQIRSEFVEFNCVPAFPVIATSASGSKTTKLKASLHKCKECNYTTKWSYALTNHMRLHNNTEFKCTHCDYCTAWKNDLKDHTRQHTGETFDCVECDFRSVKKQSLEKHMRIHSGCKPFKCTQCDYRSTQSANLKKHMAKHSDSKPFKCDRCSYQCRQKGQLQKHITQHHGRKVESGYSGQQSDEEYVYICQICRHPLATSIDYIQHIISEHVKGEQHVCTYTCLRKFNNNTELSSHWQTEHSERVKRRYVSNTEDTTVSAST